MVGIRVDYQIKTRLVVLNAAQDPECSLAWPFGLHKLAGKPIHLTQTDVMERAIEKPEDNLPRLQHRNGRTKDVKILHD